MIHMGFHIIKNGKSMVLKNKKIGLVCIGLLFQSCVILEVLDPKDHNAYLINDWNASKINPSIVEENRIYLHDENYQFRSEKCYKFIIFTKGYFVMSGTCNLKWFEEKNIQKEFYKNTNHDKVGFYKIEDNTVTLVFKQNFRIDQRKRILGSEWKFYTLEMKGKIDINGRIENLTVSKFNPAIKKEVQEELNYNFHLSDLSFQLNTDLIAKSIKER